MQTIDEQINEVLRLAGVQPLNEEQLNEGVKDIARKGIVLGLISMAIFAASAKENKKINLSNPSKEDVITVKQIYNELINKKDNINVKTDSLNNAEYSNSVGKCNVMSEHLNSSSNENGEGTSYASHTLFADCVMPGYNKHIKLSANFQDMTTTIDDKNSHLKDSTTTISNTVHGNDTDSSMVVSLKDAEKMAKMINQIKADTGFANSQYGQPTTAQQVQDYTKSAGNGSYALWADTKMTNHLQDVEKQ